MIASQDYCRDESKSPVEKQDFNLDELSLCQGKPLDDDGVDWDELIAALEEDVKAERFRFISTHADPIEASAELERYFDAILEKVLHGAEAASGA
jgi:predicted RNA-binding protein associated with RNAse of E/G family